jgi:cysteine synthase A
MSTKNSLVNINVLIGSFTLIGVTATILLSNCLRCKEDKKEHSVCKAKAYLQLIGNTSLVELTQLSKLTGCRIYAKMECMNPGGTGKDRAAKYMLKEAMQNYDNLPKHHDHDSEHNGEVSPSPVMFEGTSGSTGIALACLCNAMGLKLHVVMPDDQAEEKRTLLNTLGVTVTIVPCAGISNKDHYVNTARRMAKEKKGIFLGKR